MTIAGTIKKHARASAMLMYIMKARVKTTWMTDRKKTLTFSCTWSDTFWQSAERRDVTSPVLVAPKKSSSCCSSDSKSFTRSRAPKRPPMTMKVEPRKPVKIPVKAEVRMRYSR